jgi:hypothetical protein
MFKQTISYPIIRLFFWTFISLAFYQTFGALSAIFQIKIPYYWDTLVYYQELKEIDYPYLYPPPTQMFFTQIAQWVSAKTLGSFFAIITFLSSFALMIWLIEHEHIKLPNPQNNSSEEHTLFYEMALAITFLAFLTTTFWSCITGNLHSLIYLAVVALLLSKSNRTENLSAIFLGLMSVFKPTMLILALIKPKKAYLSILVCTSLLGLSAFYYPSEFKHFLYQAKSRNLEGDYGSSLGLSVIYGGIKYFYQNLQHQSMWYHLAMLIHLAVFACLSFLFFFSKRFVFKKIELGVWVLLIFLANPRIKLYDLPYISLLATFLMFHQLNQIGFVFKWQPKDWLYFSLSLSLGGGLFLYGDTERVMSLIAYVVFFFVLLQSILDSSRIKEEQAYVQKQVFHHPTSDAGIQLS